MDRRGAGAARMPGPPRKAKSRRLGDIQRQVDARRGARRSEKARRGRTAARAGLRGDEAAYNPDSDRRQALPRPGTGAAGAPVRRLGQTGPGDEMAEGARGREGRPENTRSIVSKQRVSMAGLRRRSG